MTQIELTLRAKPWEPTPSSRMSHQLAFYDVPLAGIIRQRRAPWHRTCHYLFWCAAGGGSEHGIWVYAPLRRQEIRRLKTLTGKDLMRAQLQIIGERKVTVALAHHEHGIEYAASRNLMEESPADPATSAGKALGEGLSRDRDAIDQLFAMA